MSLELIMDVLAEIGMDETPDLITNSLEAKKPEPSVVSEDLTKHTNYWQGPGAKVLRSYWNEPSKKEPSKKESVSPDDSTPVPKSQSPPVAEKLPPSPPPSEESNSIDETANISSSESFFTVRKPRYPTPVGKKTVEPDSSEDKSMVRHVRKRLATEPLANYYESLSSLLDTMNLQVKLPGIPIMPLSSLAYVISPAITKRRKMEENTKFESIYKQKKQQIRKLGGDIDCKIVHGGRNILNIERHLSPYATLWAMITPIQSSLIDYPSRAKHFFEFSNACKSCDLDDVC